MGSELSSKEENKQQEIPRQPAPMQTVDTGESTPTQRKAYGKPRSFNASDASYDITTDAGQLKLWRALNALQSSIEPYDQIIGFIEKGIRLPDNSMLQGYT